MIDDYRQLVQELFDNSSSRIIANSSAQHASVLYAAMFQHAQKEIRILCDNLSPEVFGDAEVIKATESFLEKTDVNLKIGILSNCPLESAFLDLLKKKMAASQDSPQKTSSEQRQISIYRFPEIIVNNKVINFAVMDKTGYRFEPDHQKCCAIACANDSDFSLTLANLFDNKLPVPNSN